MSETDGAGPRAPENQNSVEPVKVNGIETANAMVSKPVPRFAISWFLLLVALVCVSVFFVLSKLGLLKPDGPASELIDIGGAYAPRVAGGELWRLVTALFLHASLGHLLANLIGLAQFFRMQKVFRERQIALIYFASGIAGGVLGLYEHPFQVAVGASGAILGLFGASIGDWMVHLRREGRAALRGPKFYSVIIAFAILVPTLFSQNTHADWAGHIGGVVVGFVLGFFATETRGHFQRFNMATEVASVAAIAVGFFLAIQIPPLPDVLDILSRSTATFKAVGQAEKEIRASATPPLGLEKLREQERLITEKELKPILKMQQELGSIGNAVKDDPVLGTPVLKLKALGDAMTAVYRIQLFENAQQSNRLLLKANTDSQKVSFSQAYETIMGKWIPDSRAAERQYLPQISQLDALLGQPKSPIVKAEFENGREQLFTQASRLLSMEMAESLRSDVHHFVETVGAKDQTEQSLSAAGQFLATDFKTHIETAQAELDGFVKAGGKTTDELEKQLNGYRVSYSTLSLFVLDIKIRTRFARVVLPALKTRKPDRVKASAFVQGSILPLVGEFKKVDARNPASKESTNSFNRAIEKLQESRRAALSSLLTALKTKNVKQTQAALASWLRINASPLGVSVLKAANHVIQVIDHPK
jgi:membrane associated rhomboid family serine protease